MKIAGLQKLTLLDYPGRLACTVFLAGCNLRCPFCQNADLVLPGSELEEIGLEELLAFLQKRTGVLQGVCVTGGEPLLSDEIFSLLRSIRALGYPIKLDTNGTFPDRLEAAVWEGLVDYVAMDIKNQPARYGETVGIPDFDPAPVERSAAFLLSGTVDYEFRTTVVRELHCAQDFEAIGRWLRGARRYFLQGFVDSGRLISPGLHAASREKMEQYEAIMRSWVPDVSIRGI